MKVDELISERFLPDTHLKARKSLVTSALLAIVASSIEITSEEFSFYVFSVRVEQVTLIVTAQIVTLVLLLFFLIRAFPTFLEKYKTNSIKRLELLGNIERAGVMEDHLGHHESGSDFDGSLESEIRWVEEKWSDLKIKREATLKRIALTYDTFAETTLDFLFPILLSAIAISTPELPKTLALNLFANQSEMVETIELLVPNLSPVSE